MMRFQVSASAGFRKFACGAGQLAAGQPDLIGCRPFRSRRSPPIPAIDVGHARQHRMAMLGIIDGGLQHVAQRSAGRSRAASASSHRTIPGMTVASRPSPGMSFEAFAPIMFDGRAGRRRRPARRSPRPCPSSPNRRSPACRRLGRRDAARPPAARSRPPRRVEGVAALFQHAHADGGGDPMGRGDDAECAEDFGPGGECAHAQSFRVIRFRVGRARRADRRPAG